MTLVPNTYVESMPGLLFKTVTVLEAIAVNLSNEMDIEAHARAREYPIATHLERRWTKFRLFRVHGLRFMGSIAFAAATY